MFAIDPDGGHVKSTPEIFAKTMTMDYHDSMPEISSGVGCVDSTLGYRDFKN